MLPRRLSAVRDQVIYDTWKKYVDKPDVADSLRSSEIIDIFNEELGEKNFYRIKNKQEDYEQRN